MTNIVLDEEEATVTDAYTPQTPSNPRNVVDVQRDYDPYVMRPGGNVGDRRIPDQFEGVSNGLGTMVVLETGNVGSPSSYRPHVQNDIWSSEVQAQRGLGQDSRPGALTRLRRWIAAKMLGQ